MLLPPGAAGPADSCQPWSRTLATAPDLDERAVGSAEVGLRTRARSGGWLGIICGAMGARSCQEPERVICPPAPTSRRCRLASRQIQHEAAVLTAASCWICRLAQDLATCRTGSRSVGPSMEQAACSTRSTRTLRQVRPTRGQKMLLSDPDNHLFWPQDGRV